MAYERTPVGHIEAVENAVPVARRQLIQWQTTDGVGQVSACKELIFYQHSNLTCIVHRLRSVSLQLILDLAAQAATGFDRHCNMCCRLTAPAHQGRGNSAATVRGSAGLPFPFFPYPFPFQPQTPIQGIQVTTCSSPRQQESSWTTDLVDSVAGR